MPETSNRRSQQRSGPFDEVLFQQKLPITVEFKQASVEEVDIGSLICFVTWMLTVDLMENV